MLSRFLRENLRVIKRKFGKAAHPAPKGVITAPCGSIPLEGTERTLVVVVGPQYDQNVPTAMMTFRSGYCNAFEELGIPFVIVDHSDLQDVLPSLNQPFCMLNGSDFLYIDPQTVRLLRNYPHSVWVDPWFENSDSFFAGHGLDGRIWTWSDEHRRKILDSEPTFVHTATVASGLDFFSGWEQHGAKLIVLPLACDTHLYHPQVALHPEFNGVEVAFVGGYWASKGAQIDKYLRKLEDNLVVYGYNEWPYKGYRGHLPRELEPALYRQAVISPSINEPTVSILHGQINERVFKVLGSGGLTIVDAVPFYRELFQEDELIIPGSVDEFHDVVQTVLRDPLCLEGYRSRGLEAVLQRHTYLHRAKTVLKELGIGEQ